MKSKSQSFKKPPMPKKKGTTVRAMSSLPRLPKKKGGAQ